MPHLTLQIHPSIRIQGEPYRFEGTFTSKSIRACIVEVLKSNPAIYELIIQDDKLKPGLLFLADKTELLSLGLLDEDLDEDLQIKVVPILHGG